MKTKTQEEFTRMDDFRIALTNHYNQLSHLIEKAPTLTHSQQDRLEDLLHDLDNIIADLETIKIGD